MNLILRAEIVGNDGVAGLVVAGDELILFLHNAGFLFNAHNHLDGSLFYVGLGNGLGIFAGGKQCRFVKQVFEVCSGESCGGLRDDFEAYVGGKGRASRMNLEDFLPSLNIGISHHYLTVETAGTCESGIENVGPVGGSDDDDPFVCAESVHFNKQLV